MNKQCAPILIIEDNMMDYEVIERSFKKVELNIPIVHCKDGAEGLDYLHRRNKFENDQEVCRPSLVLLDLDMPRVTGYQVLTDIKSHANLRSIPVIILTTSRFEKDVNACYQAGANSYIQKPIGLKGFQEIAQQIKDYWFRAALLANN